jgi:hypothetical protein
MRWLTHLVDRPQISGIEADTSASHEHGQFAASQHSKFNVNLSQTTKKHARHFEIDFKKSEVKFRLLLSKKGVAIEMCNVMSTGL